jgi:hypothetical protein
MAGAAFGTADVYRWDREQYGRVQNDNPSGNYITFIVAGIESTTIYGASPRTGNMSLTVSPDAILWRGRFYNITGLKALKVGDQIFAKLGLSPQGSLWITLLYANIINRFGYVSQIINNKIMINVAEGRGQMSTQARIIHAYTGLKAIMSNGTTIDASLLQVGWLVQVIGRRLADDSIVPTKLWTWLPR